MDIYYNLVVYINMSKKTIQESFSFINFSILNLILIEIIESCKSQA